MTSSLHAALWSTVVWLAASHSAAQDTLVVRTDNRPDWGNNISLVREIRIGQLDGPAEYTFGRVTSVTAGPDGSIFVADAQVPVVRQYNATGAHIRNWGRQGRGPGELQNP